MHFFHFPCQDHLTRRCFVQLTDQLSDLIGAERKLALGDLDAQQSNDEFGDMLENEEYLLPDKCASAACIVHACTRPTVHCGQRVLALINGLCARV